MRNLTLAGLAVGLGFVLLLPTALRGHDPVLGTWKLNLAKSKYTPGPPPRSEIRIYQPHPEGIHVVVNTVEADGRPTRREFTFRPDMKDHPVHGEAPFDSLSPEFIDERTVTAE